MTKPNLFLLALISLNLSITPLWGQGSFIPHSIQTSLYNNLINPNSVNTADLNGDGYSDLIVGTNEGMVWYKNSPNQNFEVFAIPASSGTVLSLEVADVDGDHDIDILVAFRLGKGIFWFENDGADNFLRHQVSTTTSGGRAIYASDIDGDGDIDILSAAGKTGTGKDYVVWHENDGNQYFTDHIIGAYTSNSLSMSISSIDMDNDGDIDVIYSRGADDDLVWYENDGNQNFLPHTISDYGGYTHFVIDLDQDQDLDILSGYYKEGDEFPIVWYENNGSQGFQEHKISNNFHLSNAISAKDIDGDSDLDILVAAYGDDKIVWFENDGNQLFNSHTITSNTAHVNSVKAIDLDGDLDFDIISSSENDNKVAWYKNNGQQSFTEIKINIPKDPEIAPTSVFVSDLNSDSRQDILVSSSKKNQIVWYENIGDESFVSHIATSETWAPDFVSTTDLDSDNDVDLLVIASGLYWYENSGDETFTKHTVTNNATFASKIIAADLDNDGDQDLVSDSGPERSRSWFENDGEQNFTAHSLPFGRGPIFLTDFDSDGDTDILSYQSQSIVWLENDGEQNFINHTLISGFNGVYDIRAEDFDADGNIDILFSSWYALHMFQNDGDGNFTEQNSFSSLNANPDALYSLDVNNDGKLDIVTSTSRNIFWFQNIGNLNFEKHILSVPPTSYASIFVADINSDGAEDIIYASHIEDRFDNWDDNIGWLENNVPIGLSSNAKLSNSSFSLNSNYPNPFNKETNFEYQLPVTSHVLIEVYDLLGRKICTLINKNQTSGPYTVKWDGKDQYGQYVTNGFYLYRMVADNHTETQKMTLIR